MAKSRTNGKTNGNGKTFATQQALDAYIWSICNILRYVPPSPTRLRAASP